ACRRKRATSADSRRTCCRSRSAHESTTAFERPPISLSLENDVHELWFTNRRQLDSGRHVARARDLSLDRAGAVIQRHIFISRFFAFERPTWRRDSLAACTGAQRDVERVFSRFWAACGPIPRKRKAGWRGPEMSAHHARCYSV